MNQHTRTIELMFFVYYSVLEQIFNCFHLPNQVCFPMLCIGYYNCALKWLDVDFCNGSFALYVMTVQPSNNVTLPVVRSIFVYTI